MIMYMVICMATRSCNLFMCTRRKHTTLIYVRTKPQANIEKALAKIEAVMKKNNPAYPFEYKFVDDQFKQMF